MTIEEYKEIEKFISENKGTTWSTDFCWTFWRGYTIKVDVLIKKLKNILKRKNSPWIKITKTKPLPKFIEVLAYNEEWIHPDFNPEGIRIGTCGEDGFISAVWESENDTYTYCSEDGDDFETFQIDSNGKKHTWYTNKDGVRVEGHRPNMPTHYMLIPKKMA